LVKNSFTLIEVIFSLIIIAVIISGYSNLILNSNSSNNYDDLNTAYNNFLDGKKLSSNKLQFLEH